MSLYSVNSLPETPKESTVHLMNYTTHDFSMDYLDNDNKPHTVKIPALDTASFNSKLAPVVANHLANFILNLQGFSYKTDANIEIAKIKEKITINE